MKMEITKEYTTLVDNDEFVFMTILNLKHTLIFYKIRDFLLLNQSMKFEQLASAVKTIAMESKHKINFYEDFDEFGVYYNSAVFPIHIIYKNGKYRKKY